MEPQNNKREIPEQFKHIKGWGIDADPKNDPTFPMRDRSKETHGGMDWDRPVQQPADVEILHSNERPNLTAVFGPTNPPKGLSGMLRRFAFKYSESDYRHWLSLLAADRLDVLGGLAEDVSKGHIPRMLKERGYGAEWKYNRRKTLVKAAVAAGATAALAAVVVARTNRRRG